MKRTLSTLLATSMVLGLAACGSSSPAPTTAATTAAAETVAAVAEATEAVKEAASEEKPITIAFFMFENSNTFTTYIRKALESYGAQHNVTVESFDGKSDQSAQTDAITTALAKGNCKYCRTGRTNLCEKLVRIGFERDGSHEEYCIIPEENAFKVADWIPFEQVTGFPDAVGCMYNAIKNVAKVKPGERVLILGVGGLGMNAIQLARIFGAEVFATSRRTEKLEIAKQMGADHVINTKTENLAERIKEITGGEMLDVVIDNIGIRDSINDSLKLVCAGGRVIVTGYYDPQFVTDYQDIMKFEKQILGMRGMTRQDLAEVIRLVENHRMTPYVYKTMPFEKINEALQEMRDGKALGRIVLLMNHKEGE